MFDTRRNMRISAVHAGAFDELWLTIAFSSSSSCRAGRQPAPNGEKVRDYPQLSARLPHEFKARLNALSAVTGLAQWRVIVEALNCFVHGFAADRPRASLTG